MCPMDGRVSARNKIQDGTNMVTRSQREISKPGWWGDAGEKEWDGSIEVHLCILPVLSFLFKDDGNSWLPSSHNEGHVFEDSFKHCSLPSN